jgi:hypothetical protein
MHPYWMQCSYRTDCLCTEKLRAPEIGEAVVAAVANTGANLVLVHLARWVHSLSQTYSHMYMHVFPTHTSSSHISYGVSDVHTRSRSRSHGNARRRQRCHSPVVHTHQWDTAPSSQVLYGSTPWLCTWLKSSGAVVCGRRTS